LYLIALNCQIWDTIKYGISAVIPYFCGPKEELNSKQKAQECDAREGEKEGKLGTNYKLQTRNNKLKWLVS